MVRAWIIAILLFCLTACSNSPKRHSEADIDFLASDAHVVVGETRLVAPFIALTGYVAQKPSFSLDRRGDRTRAKEQLDAFRTAASAAVSPPALDTLEISIDTYGWDDFDPSLKRICSRLRRQWSRSLCDNPWSPLRQAMPEGAFHVTDIRKFSAFDNYRTVGGERKSDQLRSMRLKLGKPSVVCDRTLREGKRFCSAAILLAPHLAAVWAVWDGRKETSDQQAYREGAAIVAFVRDALGPRENFPALFASACRLRRPDRSEGPDGDICK